MRKPFPVSLWRANAMLIAMDIFALTRQLIDIESVTGNETAVGEFLYGYLSRLGYDTQLMPVEENRSNVYAVPRGAQRPPIFFSTHMDTVPPFIASSEDKDAIYGRGACDAKGIMAAQIAAADKLRDQGTPAGLLFLVGEERDSQGARVANANAMGGQYLINGEPTGNKLAVASKGALRVELTASGKMAHSAYPELGDSAIDKLLDALQRLRSMPLPSVEEIGPATFNIGVIEGGRAPNVIPDFARAQLLYRLVAPAEELKRQIVETVGALAHVEFVLEIPFVRLRSLEGIPTMVASFTTDIPTLGNWGEPLLLGPGSIHVAHTEGEHIDKRELLAAVDLYAEIARKLVSSDAVSG